MDKRKINAMENNIISLLLNSGRKDEICGLYLPCGIEDLRRKMVHPMYADKMPLDINTIAYTSVRPLIKTAIESLKAKGIIETRTNGRIYELIILSI